MIRKICLFGLCISLLAACKTASTPLQETTGEAISESVQESVTQSRLVIESETKEDTEVAGAYDLKENEAYSYLTGEIKDKNIVNRRPMAVMMSNDKAALPQYGINRASIVYEAPVEGGMNRYMALIEDYDGLERIGSVRSARTYYTYFAREWDAVLAHVGQSSFAVPYLKNVDNINGVEGIGTIMFYRSKDKSAPHNAYTSAERFEKSIAALGYRSMHEDTFAGHLTFAKPNADVVLEHGIPAIKVYPGYDMNHPYFEYHVEDGLYYRYQYGNPHKGSEGQIAVDNIILQYSPIGYYASTAYLNINIHEKTYGYYMTGGRAIPITIEKASEFAPTKFYDTQGKEIIFNVGKTWICIINAAKFENTKIYDANGKQTN